MSVIVSGMEMPEHCGYCRFRYDGICHALQKTQYSMEECPLVPVPEHGRCIDADALVECLATLLQFPSNLVNGQWIVNTLREQPTIIPASEVGE